MLGPKEQDFLLNELKLEKKSAGPQKHKRKVVHTLREQSVLGSKVFRGQSVPGSKVFRGAKCSGEQSVPGS